MNTRCIKNKINFYKGVQKGRNDLLMKIMAKVEILNTKWIRDIKSKITETNLTYEQVKEMKFEDIKVALMEWDRGEWRRELEQKSTLNIYRQYKKDMKEEIYYNDEESRILFLLKTNTIRLNYRRRHEGGEVRCRMCEAEREDLEHFLLDCLPLEEERRRIKKLQRPLEEDRERVIGELLFEGKEESKRNLYAMWKRRQKIVESMEGVNE